MSGWLVTCPRGHTNALDKVMRETVKPHEDAGWQSSVSYRFECPECGEREWP